MNELTTEDEWNEQLTRSAEVPFFVFKHSTTCPISARASDRVRQYEANAGGESPEIVMVKVIESRAVSNLIASQLDVTHQSPQLILVRGGRAAWDASHHLIQPDAIEEALAQI